MSEAPEERSKGRKWLPILWGLGLLALGFGIYLVFQSLLGKHGPAKPTLKQITMVKIQTPPPPPPKPPEKPPEPPQQKQEVKMDEPKPQEAPKPADEPPPAQAKLGVDADASGEGDGFGLGANKGGRDLVGSGTIGGTGTGRAAGSEPVARLQYTFYRDVVTRHLSDILGKIPELKEADAVIPVSIWVGKTGRIERIEITAGNLPADRIQTMRNALLNGPALRQLPPDNMPQPLRLKVKVQEAG